MSRSAPPPTHQEVTRKLSVHSKPPPKKSATPGPVSGTESDSDSVFSPEASSALAAAASGAGLATSPSQQPHLSSIAERHSASGEESDEDDEDEPDWRASAAAAKERGSLDETVLMTGYLWKKGERRKVYPASLNHSPRPRSPAQTWKKRWFVLRPAHLAFYKTSAEYKLLRLLDLTEVHACTPVVLKKHANTFGLVSPTRTFYLQAEAPREVQAWVVAINDARTALLATSTQNSATAPVPIPPGSAARNTPRAGSQSPHANPLTSSDSDDASPAAATTARNEASPSKQAGAPHGLKVVLSGYLMKCGSRRHNWHKRWFVLSGEKLVYSRSHMDTKPHREIPLSLILDALEYDLPAHRHMPSAAPPPGVSPPHAPHAGGDEGDGAHGRYTFKVVTTKRTLLLCAPSEEEEIKWLSAVRALIARRSGQGVVPGDAAPAGKAMASAGGPSSEVQGSAGGVSPFPGSSGGGGAASSNSSTSVGAGAGAGRRRDSFARRLSMSGGATLATTVPSTTMQEASGI
ncbi:uncharacterized protein FIBRA_05751 [Fibroporia radiculosa]|uniref:PH domain-containing protein n=1 Tax=Fibroporia radiculosa TaxID=599839 RepID=J4GA17_9APHY|nr:uncharacterized protein FIBRA_05751 [Fibroporia radiculosa]CCM03613.1 predicted protein [Fibroporia radiculosa]